VGLEKKKKKDRGDLTGEKREREKKKRERDPYVYGRDKWVREKKNQKG
jgi:hypothetical protein